jgi:hypothetical protein
MVLGLATDQYGRQSGYDDSAMRGHVAHSCCWSSADEHRGGSHDDDVRRTYANQHITHHCRGEPSNEDIGNAGSCDGSAHVWYQYGYKRADMHIGYSCCERHVN